MLKFSQLYIDAQQTNSQGKPMAPQYLQERDRDLEYIREQQAIESEYQGDEGQVLKPKDEEYARRLRELHLKYNPNNKVMRDYHEKRQKETLSGGLADGVPASKFDPDALAEGTKIEMEHTTDAKMAEEIAKDHLSEDPEYYKKLKQMEQGD